MLKNKKVKLESIAKLKILKELERIFYDVTKMVISIRDHKSGALYFFPKQKRSKFCNLILSNRRGKERCAEDDLKAAAKAFRKRNVHIYKCHLGMDCAVIPVIANGEHLATIYTGEFLTTKPTKKKFLKVKEKLRDLKMDFAKLEPAFNKVPVFSKERVKVAVELLSLMANYVIKVESAMLFQKRVSEERLKLLKESKDKAELGKTLKETELKFLQSQINPHFLFNTLNTISNYALLEESPKTHKLIDGLSEVLRYSLDKTGQKITLAEEIGYIKKYLHLQEMRFEAKIALSLNLPLRIRKTRIPSMTLQPIIENSVLHGFKGKKGKKEVSLKGYEKGRNIILEVKDNGKGMEREHLEEIRRSLNTLQESPKVKGSGLLNVQKRLQYHFGPGYEIKIESKLGQGTEVAIPLPKRQ